MRNGMGPHAIISAAEVGGTLVVLGVFLVGMALLAYNVRWKPSH